ncbi:MAG: hypothetical protein K2M12_09385, partial [Muribaculaceae bacterium]|nr:hypothetical protein [Muribaculaceae bacterium]
MPELPAVPDYTLVDEDVKVEVTISLPEMDKRSRAALDEASLNQVQTLWVRTYSSEDGKATSEWVVLEPNTVDTEKERTVTIDTKSGPTYIVAVANVDNLGVTADNLEERRALSELLKDADTWDKFLKIAVVAPSTFEGVRAPVPPLPMSGCYSTIKVGGVHPGLPSVPEPSNPGDWQNRNYHSVFIPAAQGVNHLEGAIHLRRLVSHVNFKIKIGDPNMEVDVLSFRVMNAPRYSWLYERNAANGPANFGDVATEETVDTYFADIDEYPAQYITVDDKGVATFDFWLGENKHAGTCDKYSDRDKRADGKPTLFSSLTGDAWTANNEASYVLFDCDVNYKNNIRVDDDGAVVEYEEGSELVSRTGNATYMVHMGYIGGENVDEAIKAKDFNCFRNVDYTYNITINGLDDIRVDAFASDETYAEKFHGEEGLVLDLPQQTLEIDAHYNAFNVFLSDEELQGVFGFIIVAYENGQSYTISEENAQQNIGTGNVVIYDDTTSVGANIIPAKYYNWIELRPTSKNVLAVYKPRYGGNSDGKTFLLTDLKNPLPDEQKSPSGWYTIFVNEYTYEPMYTGTDGYANEETPRGQRPAWMGYINQDPRRFYIRVTRATSPDGNSVYGRAKYGVSQYAMMSYFSRQNVTDDGTHYGTASGGERINETEGFNMCPVYNGGSSMTNGRWNTAQYLDNSSNTTDPSINNPNVNSRPEWTDFITPQTPMEIEAVAEDRLQNGPAIPSRLIKDNNPLALPGLVNLPGENPSFNDPQTDHKYNIDVVNSCMSRNRDNNGNGRIDPDELRWYVPAMDQYLAITLGGNSLPRPIMDYLSVPALPKVRMFTEDGKKKCAWDENGVLENKYCSRYMAVSSNNGAKNRVLWLMEGTSMSAWYPGGLWTWSTNTGEASHPWITRCIRNLGSNMTQVLDEDKVVQPYVHDEAAHKVRMTFYDAASIRPNPYGSNGTGAAQMPLHSISSSYNSVYYAFEYNTE